MTTQLNEQPCSGAELDAYVDQVHRAVLTVVNSVLMIKAVPVEAVLYALMEPLVSVLHSESPDHAAFNNWLTWFRIGFM